MMFLIEQIKFKFGQVKIEAHLSDGRVKKGFFPNEDLS